MFAVFHYLEKYFKAKYATFDELFALSKVSEIESNNLKIIWRGFFSIATH